MGWGDKVYSLTRDGKELCNGALYTVQHEQMLIAQNFSRDLGVKVKGLWMEGDTLHVKLKDGTELKYEINLTGVKA